MVNSVSENVSIQTSERLDALDGLRGIAILMVLIHHLNIFQGSGVVGGVWISVVDFCGHGVDVFFVLSGFLIFRQLSVIGERADWARIFWRRRVAKILPTYLACLAFVYLLLPSLLSLTSFAGKLHMQQAAHGNWPWYLGFASNFLNSAQGRFTNPALDVAWSLALEVQFYLLACFLFWQLRDRAVKVFPVFIVISLGLRAYAVGQGASWLSILALPWNRLDAFGFGALVFIGAFTFLGVWRLWLVGGLLCCPLVLSWSREFAWVQIVGYSMVGLGTAAAMSLAVRAEGPRWFGSLLCSRPLRWLGALSYSLYLTHIPVRAAVRDLFFKQGEMLGDESSWLRLVIFYIIAGLVCLVVGWTVHVGFEEPMRKRLSGARRQSFVST